MILNLAYPENSEIQFKISRFPDGQQTLDIVTSHLNSESLFKWAHLNREVVQIKSHLNFFFHSHRDSSFHLMLSEFQKTLGFGLRVLRYLW
jgi:hypothetical protein